MIFMPVQFNDAARLKGKQPQPRFISLYWIDFRTEVD